MIDAFFCDTNPAHKSTVAYYDKCVRRADVMGFAEPERVLPHRTEVPPNHAMNQTPHALHFLRKRVGRAVSFSRPPPAEPRRPARRCACE